MGALLTVLFVVDSAYLYHLHLPSVQKERNEKRALSMYFPAYHTLILIKFIESIMLVERTCSSNKHKGANSSTKIEDQLIVCPRKAYSEKSSSMHDLKSRLVLFHIFFPFISFKFVR